ncbi:MAG TPA: hypothetical protein VGK73_11435 [Polyangiaceae bacterium]
MLALGVAGAQGCGGDEFCAQGSYECSSGGGAGVSAGSGSGGSNGATGGDSAGSSSSGSSARAGSDAGGSAGTESAFAGSAGADGGAGESGAAGGDSGPPACDPSALEAGCVVPEGGGIFVSAVAGDDDEGDGSQASPLKTLGEAIDRVGALRRPVPIFVCKTVYRERITLSNDGFEIHGGFACPDDGEPWTYDPTQRPQLAPTSRGVVVTLRELDGSTLSDLEIVAIDAEDPGESSVAVLLNAATNVTFARTLITAGEGKKGRNATADEYDYPSLSTLGGKHTNNDKGAAQNAACVCENTEVRSIGGGGGVGGLVAGPGSPGAPAELDGGEGGMESLSCNAGGAGGDGGDGTPVDHGPGALVRGEVSADGWTAQPGGRGQDGGPGKGGGGGRGATGAGMLVGGGGGGACGGCGGRGGNAGAGGGSSIGIVSFDSSLTLHSSMIRTAEAGDGGNGIAGQIGQAGGAHGNGSGMGCQGGNGGRGADGGAGGGGAGGISVGIVWFDGKAPELDALSSVEPGEEGAGGLGPEGNDGIEGVSAIVFEAENAEP